MRGRVLLAAVLADAALGEPPALVHPVVLMGRMLAWLDRRAPTSAAARFGYGTAVALGLPMLWGVLAWRLERWLPWPLRAAVLKPTFAGRALLGAGRQVEAALADGDLLVARTRLQSLVSRPTARLDEGLVAAAAVESLAENLTDSWVAPLLAYALFGLGGAYAYRMANTTDAMWGYRTTAYEWLGKAAARLDDALNWLPARVAALLLALLVSDPGRAWRGWRRDAHRTPSPNAGQTMAVMAGALGVRLEKPDVYVLQADAPVPGVRHIGSARNLVQRVMVASAIVALAVAARRGA